MAGEWNMVWDFYNGPDGIRGDDIIIAKINCADEPNKITCRDLGVQAYPTILHFQAGSNTTNNNFRDSRNSVEFIKWIDRSCAETEE